MENRQELRYPVWEPVILSVGSGQPERQHQAHLIDISKSGLCVVSDLKIEAETSVHIALGHLSIEATVTHCSPHGGEMYALGAAITSLELHGANRAEAQDNRDAGNDQADEAAAAAVKPRRKRRPLTSSPAFTN